MANRPCSSRSGSGARAFSMDAIAPSIRRGTASSLKPCLATNAETASGDGTSALPSGGVFSFAEARTATGGDSSALRLSRSGVWSRNVSRSGLNSSVQRELTYLGNDLVLEYEPGSCGYTIWPLRRPETMPAHAPA